MDKRNTIKSDARAAVKRVYGRFSFGIRDLSLNLQYDCCCPSPTSARACRVRAGTFFA